VPSLPCSRFDKVGACSQELSVGLKEAAMQCRLKICTRLIHSWPYHDCSQTKRINETNTTSTDNNARWADRSLLYWSCRRSWCDVTPSSIFIRTARTIVRAATCDRTCTL